MERTIDVTALGELLIDFTESGLSPQGNPMLEANPGGAPCNLLAMLARLGHTTAFLGKVGHDAFGDMLRQRVSGVGVDVSGLRVDEDIPTTLAFVHTQPGGERDFSFYRKPGADLMLREDEVDFDKIAASRVFHFGTLSSTGEPARSATRAALAYAKAHGCLVSFDPNLRPPLWDSLDRARAEIDFGMSQCDVLKISDNEIEFMTGETDIDAGVNKLLQRHPVPLVLATTGYSDEQLAVIDAAAREVPIFRSANMSLGINVLLDLVRRACAVLGEGYDVEIVERHHNRKLDAPSGTALMIADAAAEALPYEANYVYERQSVRRSRDKHEIGISSVRGGGIVGDHEVIFAGRDEVIEIKHSAMSREVFASGAVNAARFLAGCTKPGLYSMADLVASR